MTARVLFLHGGPGLNAILERRRWRHLLVHWWDQPQFTLETSAPYEQLIAAAHEELLTLSDRTQTPVPILASSFGAHLALTLMKRFPERVGAVTLVGGIVDVRSALVQLGRFLGTLKADNGLLSASDAAESDRGRVWALIEQIFRLPGLLDCYWSSGAETQRQEMNDLAAAGNLIHEPTFESVLRDVLAKPLPTALPEWHAPVSVLVGRQDPYVRDSDESVWKRLLPSSQIRWVQAGHFPHLELEPALWMPAGR